MKHKFVAKPDGSLSIVRKVGLAGWAKKLQYLRCIKIKFYYHSLVELTAWPALYYCVHLNIQILVQLIEKIWYYNYVIYLFFFTSYSFYHLVDFISNINVPIEKSLNKKKLFLLIFLKNLIVPLKKVIFQRREC